MFKQYVLFDVSLYIHKKRNRNKILLTRKSGGVNQLTPFLAVKNDNFTELKLLSSHDPLKQIKKKQDTTVEI